MLSRLMGRMSWSSQPPPATIKDEPASSVYGGDRGVDEDGEGGMEGLEFQDTNASADGQVGEEEEGDPNSQLSPQLARHAALEDPDPEEDFEDPSSQLIQPPPPASSRPKKKPKKKAKKTATLPEVEEEDEENRRGSRLSVEIPIEPIMSDDRDVDRQVNGALKPTQMRAKNGRFGKKAKAAADKAQREADAQMLNGIGSSESLRKAKKSRKSKADAEMDAEVDAENQVDPEGQPKDYSIYADNAPVPLKSTKGKRKAKLPKVKLKRATVNGGNTSNGDASQEENSQEYLLRASNQLRSDALSSAPQPDENEDGTPSRPSNKALGKRKAVEPITDTAKKSKRRKTTEPAGRDLTQFGFSQSRSRSISKDHGSLSGPHESLSAAELEKTARSLYSQTVRDESAQKASTTAILPHGYDRSAPGRRFPTPKRYSTPHFTPVNRAPTSVSERRIEREPDKRVEPVRDQSEPVEINEMVEDVWSVPQSRSPVPSSNGRRKKKHGAPAEEPENSEPSVVDDEQNEDEADSARGSQSLAPASAPSGKRKRRLTSYEAESSTANSKKTLRTPGKLSSKDKTPKSPKTPKTPKPSKTPKATATPGQLSKDDIETISDAIENYRDMHDMTDFEINAMVQGSAAVEGKDLWKDVYDFVPHISKTKILNSARRKFHNFDGRGVWTKEQDEDLRDAHKLYPGKWTKISQLINKFPEDCRDRWRNYLICGDKQRKDLWDQEEEVRLKSAVRKSLKAIRDLQKHDKTTRDKPEETLINWAHISEAMNHTRSRIQCAAKWKQLKERQDSSDSEIAPLDTPLDANPWRAHEAEQASRAMSPPKKLEVLRAIRNSEAGNERRVPWIKVKEEADFGGKALALKALFRNLKKQIPEHREMRFRKILDFLIEKFENSMPDEPEEFAALEPLPEKKRRRSIQKRKSIISSARVSEDENDNGEGPSASSRRPSKRTSKSASEEVQIEDPEDDDSGNADGPSTVSEPPTTSKLKLKSKAKSRLLSQERSVEKPKSRPAVVIQSHRKETPKPVSEEEVVDEASREPEETPMPSRRKHKSRSKSDKSSRNEKGRFRPTSNEDPAESEDDFEVPDPNPRDRNGMSTSMSHKAPSADGDDFEEQDALPRSNNGKFKSKGNRSPFEDRADREVEDAVPRSNNGKFKSKFKEVRKFILDEATVGAAEESEDGGSSATKKRRQSKSKKTSPAEEEDIDEEQSDGHEVPATLERPKSKSKSRSSEEQGINGAKPTPKTTKKKFRERMKLSGESQSQEYTSGNQTSTQDTNNDIEMVLSSLENGKGKSGKDKGHEPDRIAEIDEEPMAAVSHHESDENADQMDVDDDEEESILDQEEPLNTHVAGANADEMDLDEDYAVAEDIQVDSDSISEQEQEEIRDHSPSVDLNASKTDDSDDEESSNGDAGEPASFVNGMDHDSKEADDDRDFANRFSEEELEDFERRHPTSDSDEDELANGVGHEESDEELEKQSIRSDSNEADIEPHRAGDIDQDDEDNKEEDDEDEDEDQDVENQSPVNDSDEADEAEIEQPLANGHESHDDLEPPIINGEDLEDPTSSNEEQPAQELDETSTSGSDSDSESESESDDETSEKHSPVVTNGFHRGSPSPDIQRESRNLDADRKDVNSPPRGASPSPDLDTPKANDGRRRATRSPTTFGRYRGRRNRFVRSPSVSSGSDSSIPARVHRRRSISPEGSVEL